FGSRPSAGLTLGAPTKKLGSENGAKLVTELGPDHGYGAASVNSGTEAIWKPAERWFNAWCTNQEIGK
ncbi:hypothetical protein, partial [Escherichia coli]|uniref:hypothetical protein n=1 Tax=Escherichia coli TaxID=562 RepID=UPI000BD964F3